jgi:hypothetical protein
MRGIIIDSKELTEKELWQTDCTVSCQRRSLLLALSPSENMLKGE